MDAKKQSHTSSELSIIKGYLFRGRFTDHSPLREWATGTEFSSQKRESKHTLYIDIYSKRGHTQMGSYLKGYWLKDFLQQ